MLLGGRPAFSVHCSLRAERQRRVWSRHKTPGPYHRSLPDSEELGGIESLSYEILGTEAKTRDGLLSGEIPINDDGVFDLPIFTNELQGRQRITLLITGKNGRTRTESVILKQGKSAIPDFNVRSSDGKALASWNPLPTAEGYELVVSGDRNAVKRYSAAAGPVEVPRLENGRLYRFRLEASTARGRFSSHEVSVIPLSPETLRPEVSGEYRRIRVSWNPIQGSERYCLYRSRNPEGPMELIAENLMQSPFLDTGVEYGTEYWYAAAPAAFPDEISRASKGSTLAQQEARLEKLARVSGQENAGITVVGDYAYVAAFDEGLFLYDITESTRPGVSGTLSFSGALDIAVRGDYAYVASGEEGIRIVNISDPVHPFLVGSRKAGDAAAVGVEGNYVYAADREKGLRILDISNPQSPLRISATEGLVGQDLLVSGRTVYLATENKGLVILDAADPSSPKILSSLETGTLRSLTLRGGLLAAFRPNRRLGSYRRFPAEFAENSFPSSDVNASRICLMGDFALALGEQTLHVVDIRIPQKPSIFDSIEMEGSYSFAVHGDDILVTTREGLEVYRTFLTGQSYVLLGRDLPGRSYDLMRYGEHLYVSAHAGGVHILDARSLEPVADLETDYAEKTAVRGPWLFVADGISGLQSVSARRIAGSNGRRTGGCF